MRRWNVAQTALWSVLLIAFVAIGAPQFWHSAVEGRMLPATANSSMDSYLSVMGHDPAYSAHLTEAFKSLPANKGVVILQAEGRAGASFVAMAVAYLAWPHPVELVPISRTTNRLIHFDVATVGAFVSCGFRLPPQMSPAIALSPTVEIYLVPDNVAAR